MTKSHNKMSAGNVGAPTTDPMWTFQKVWDALIAFEHGSALFDRSVSGCYYWPLFRGGVLDSLCSRFGIFRDQQPRLRQTLWRRIRNNVALLATDIEVPLRREHATFDSIVLPFPRKFRRGGDVVDIYSYRLFGVDGIGRILFLDSGRRHSPLLKSSGALVAYREQNNYVRRSRDNLLTLSQVLGCLCLPLFMVVAKKEYDRIDCAMRREIGCPFPISLPHFALRLAFFHFGRRFFRRAILRSGARRLFLSNAQSPCGVGAAAQDLGVEVIEFQHGPMNLHADYDFPGHPYVPYAPNRILLVGPFWLDHVSAAANTKVAVAGFKNILHEPNQLARRARHALVVSQSTIGDVLFEVIIEAARAAPHWTFIYRPHPWDDAQAYRARLENDSDNRDNVIISEEPGEFYLLSQSVDVQIGVYSTGLFEGMAGGARTIVVKLPGWEHMEPVIARGDAVLAEAAADLVALLETAPQARDPHYYYAEPVSDLSGLLAL